MIANLAKSTNWKKKNRIGKGSGFFKGFYLFIYFIHQ
jgi:hypothetical protein